MQNKWMGLLMVLMMLTVLAVPVQGAETAQLDCVTDAADILSVEEWQDLEKKAETLSQQYGCSLYIITVDDFHEYGDGEIADVADLLYHYYELGEGTEQNGILLMLSMAGRDYTIFTYGAIAKEAVGSYAKELLSEAFLDDFAKGNWADGFWDYLDTCEQDLLQAEAGTPVTKPERSMGANLGIGCMVGIVVALIVCMIGRSKMKSVYKKAEADTYVSGNLVLTGRQDQYTHTTRTSRIIEKESSHADGGSSKSGKF